MKLLYALFWLIPSCAFASGNGSHSDPVASVILGVTFIFFFAVVGRYIARCLHQPGVLGELLMGVFIGNIAYYFGSELVVVLREGSAIFNVMSGMLHGTSLTDAVSEAVPNPYYAKQVTQALSGPNGTEWFKISYVVDIFSRYGVIFLLFMVGLESSVEELKHTGKESIFVAVIGVVAPIVLGLLVAMWLMPSSSIKSDLFVAATLCATSIGITARVLTEMDKLKTREARTILGAAMLDDILGLVILAIVSSIVIKGAVDFINVGQIILSAILFFALALTLGPWILTKTISLFRFLYLWEAKLFISFLFVMALAWLANAVQLATIIGAFAAGLILHDGYFKARERYPSDVLSIQNLVSPLESILAPLFFTLIGIQVKLETFFHWNVVILASGLVVAAILGKLISGLGANKNDDRLLIGIGMLPRGEVGLVFASIGRTLGVISDELFSAIIMMVMITTLLAPALMKMRYSKMAKLNEQS